MISSGADSNTRSEVDVKHSSSKLFSNIKGIIFDFDGTLFDNFLFAFHLIFANPLDCLRIWKERLVRKNFAGCDYSSPEEYHMAFFSAFGKVCLGSPERVRSWYFNRYMPRMIRVLKKYYKPRPGVIKLFQNISASSTFPRVAVYSDYPCLKERMEILGIHLDPKILLYGPESFGAQKPAARPFQIIAKDLGVKPEEVIMIGDREDTDGLGAFMAGMHFFCLETGRKRYFRLDPYRQPKKDKPHGPSLLMYAGAWDDLINLLMEKFS